MMWDMERSFDRYAWMIIKKSYYPVISYKFMRKILFIEPEKCTGCMRCELACSFRHYDEFNPLLSRIRVTFLERAIVPASCAMCDEAPCMIACPSNAYYRDENNNVMQDKDRCIGCRMCILACPFGAINYNEREHKVIKCDLCDYDPECVKHCPTSAISFIDYEEAQHRKRLEAAKRMTEVVE